MPNALLPPFSSIPIPEYMRRELLRRQNTYGINHSLSTRNKIEEYKGQMAPWMRVSSNGSNKIKDGFILRGGNGAKDSYGIGNNLETVIGMDYEGRPHVIKNTVGLTNQLHRPVPGVNGMEITITKNVYRTAFIKWKCYSVEQLNYMTPYFMTPYTTIFLEWGWNNYDPTSLVPIGKIGSEYKVDGNGVETPGDGMLGFYTNPRLFEDSLEKSNGRYDGMIGHVINYDYTFNPSDMSFDCTTEIASNSKFYFGLSMHSIVHEHESIDTSTGAKKSTKKNLSDYLCVNVHAEILSHISKMNETGNSVKTVPGSESYDPTIRNLLKGRVFSPKFYRQTTTSELASKSDSSQLYITFGCLADILTEIIKSGRPTFSINIKDTKISAHPNIISCSENFLIPNAFAPYFNSDSLSDSNRRPVDSINSENPIHSAENQNLEANKILKKVLNSEKRQDLNSIINHLRIANDPTVDYSFPEKNDPFSGKIENIFLNYDFIRDQIKSTPNIRDFLKNICQMLNDKIPIWNLDVIDWDGNFAIRDLNYLNRNDLNNLQSEYKIPGDSDEVVYYFNPFVQNSILTEFGFNVKLSDAVANMVMNQSNNITEDDVSKDTPGIVVNSRFAFPKTVDVVLKKITSEKILGTDRINDGSNGESEPSPTAQALQNINEKSIAFTQSFPNGEKRVTRLIMPGESGKAKVQQLLNDNTEAFSEINTPPIPGVRVEFSLMGIAGFRTFQVIGVKNLPKPYEEGKVVFQIVDVKHSVNTEGWTTRVSAVIRPVKSLEGLYK